MTLFSMGDPSKTPEDEIWEACRDGDLSKVKMMLNNGFDINKLNAEGDTLLSLALKGSINMEMIQTLLDRENFLTYWVDGEGCSLLYRACCLSHKGLLRAFMKAKSRLLPPNPRKEELLLLAVAQENLPELEELLKDPSLDVNYRNPLQSPTYTALQLACIRCRNENILKALLKCSDIQVNLPQIENLWTPLHFACQRGVYTEAAKLLLEHPDIDVNPQEKKGFTPLHVSIHKNSTMITYLLLKHPDIEPNIACFHRNYTPLALASEKNDHYAVKMLTVHPKVDVNCTTFRQLTPFHLAKSLANYEIVQILLKSCRFDTQNKTQEKSLDKVEMAAKYLGFLILITDDYLQLAPVVDEAHTSLRQRKFLALGSRFPFDLQCCLCNVVAQRSSHAVIKTKSFDEAIKEILWCFVF